MYVTVECPCCGETLCHDLTFELSHVIAHGERTTKIKDGETFDVCTLDELVGGIVEQLDGHVIGSHAELENVLRKIFRVSPVGCPDVVDRVSDGIGMMH